MNFTLQKNVPLADLTTLKIGGAARFFVSAKSEDEIVEALKFAAEENLETFILGGGSNILVADEGFDGLVIQIALKGISVEPTTNKTLVKAMAGENWDRFCKFCVEENLQGVECLSGIPGFVGGTPVQNVGAYGQEVSETVFSVRCFDRKFGKIVELENSECQFAYRASILNGAEKNRYVVLGVVFNLIPGGEPKIVYRDLQNYFSDKKPNLLEARNAVLKIRAEKSMVIDETDPNSKSAGSFFKNPIISKRKLFEIEKRAQAIGFQTIPFFETDCDNVKIPAAWLIEKSGFHKGFEFGRAGISSKHTLAIINRGGAAAKEIIAFKTFIQEQVNEKFGLELHQEPILIGF